MKPFLYILLVFALLPHLTVLSTEVTTQEVAQTDRSDFIISKKNFSDSCNVNGWINRGENNTPFLVYPSPKDSGAIAVQFLPTCDYIAHIIESKNDWLCVDAIYPEEACEVNLAPILQMHAR